MAVLCAPTRHSAAPTCHTAPHCRIAAPLRAGVGAPAQPREEIRPDWVAAQRTRLSPTPLAPSPSPLPRKDHRGAGCTPAPLRVLLRCLR